MRRADADLVRFLRRSRKRGLVVTKTCESQPVSRQRARRLVDLIFPPEQGASS